jgi:hypothetical protein
LAMRQLRSDVVCRWYRRDHNIGSCPEAAQGGGFRVFQMAPPRCGPSYQDDGPPAGRIHPAGRLALDPADCSMSSLGLPTTQWQDAGRSSGLPVHCPLEPAPLPPLVGGGGLPNAGPTVPIVIPAAMMAATIARFMRSAFLSAVGVTRCGADSRRVEPRV